MYVEKHAVDRYRQYTGDNDLSADEITNLLRIWWEKGKRVVRINSRERDTCPGVEVRRYGDFVLCKNGGKLKTVMVHEGGKWVPVEDSRWDALRDCVGG